MSRTQTPEGPLPEPPAFLDGWMWRQPRPAESTPDWLARTARQRNALIESCASWLQIGQRVRVHLDPRAGGGYHAGETGTVDHLCGSKSFADFTYVRFEPVAGQKVARTAMLPLEALQPEESGP